MENEYFLKIPDELIEKLTDGNCKLCDCKQPDIFGIFKPDDIEDWCGYAVILYPMHIHCMTKTNPGEIKLILEGELAAALALNNTKPFIGYREMKR